MRLGKNIIGLFMSLRLSSKSGPYNAVIFLYIRAREEREKWSAYDTKREGK